MAGQKARQNKSTRLDPDKGIDLIEVARFPKLVSDKAQGLRILQKGRDVAKKNSLLWEIRDITDEAFEIHNAGKLVEAFVTVKKKRICVYCGSRFGASPRYGKLAVELGEEMVARNLDLVYGGGRVGLMGAVSTTVMKQGGQVFGVIPEGLFGKEVADTGITDLQVVGSMHERKALMEKLSDGFLAIPGGWGTMDELFEILTWSQIGIHKKPVVVLNSEGFYDSLLKQIEVMTQEGFLDPKYLPLMRVAHTIDQALDLLINP